jgi:hypothetical protein
MQKRKRLMNLTILAAILTVAPVITSCNYEGDATVGCSHVEKLVTGMGMLNSPKMPLGNIEAVDPTSKHVGFARKLVFADSDTEVDPEDSTTDISDASVLTVTFSGQIPTSLQAQVSTQLGESLQLHVENPSRHQLDQPQDILNRTANKQSILDLMTANPNYVYLLVYGGVSTTNVTFTKKTGSATSFSLSIGKDTFSGGVTYSCQGDLTQTVTQVNSLPTPYKITFFKVVQISKTDGGDLTTKVYDGDVSTLDWTQATF